MVLKGDGDIADQGDRPAHPVGSVPRIVRVHGSRTVFASPWVLIWTCPELPTASWTIRCTTCSEGLSGRWNTITSRTARLSTGTRSLMPTPPTTSSANAAREDGRHNPGASDRGEAGDSHCREDGRQQDGGHDRAERTSHGCALGVGADALVEWQCRHSDIAPWHTPRAESRPLAGAPSPLQLIRSIRRFDPGEAYRLPCQRARQAAAGSGGIVKIPPLLRPSSRQPVSASSASTPVGLS